MGKKRMDKFKQYVTAGISFVFGVLLQYVYALAGERQFLLYSVTLLLFLVFFLCIMFAQIQARLHRVKYSILVFAFDPKERLLTVYNEFHKRRMIPCGVLKPSQTPHDAVKQFLREQAGVNPDNYETQIDNEICAQEASLPYSAQIEFITKHERHVSEHYAFIYFLRLSGKEKIGNQAAFMTLKELERLPEETSLFSDLLQRYRFYLQHDTGRQAGEGGTR